MVRAKNALRTRRDVIEREAARVEAIASRAPCEGAKASVAEAKACPEEGRGVDGGEDVREERVFEPHVGCDRAAHALARALTLTAVRPPPPLARPSFRMPTPARPRFRSPTRLPVLAPRSLLSAARAPTRAVVRWVRRQVGFVRTR